MRTRTRMQADAARGVALEEEAHHELQCYTLAHGDPKFIHQHLVDAWTAQRADQQTKPIAITFALVGLYLHLERGFSGSQVQRAHIALARHKEMWPLLILPRERGSMTARQVLAVPPGTQRDHAIDAWCAAVWDAFRESRQTVADLLQRLERQHLTELANRLNVPAEALMAAELRDLNSTLKRN